MLELAGLTFLVLFAWGLMAVALVALKLLLWVLLLPIRLLFYVFLLPLMLLKLLVGGVLLLALGPIIALAIAAGLLALLAALVVPLLPLAFVICVVWIVVRLSGGAAAPTSV